MADQLQLYNEALSHCQETKLASLVENRASRYVLDLHYASVQKYMIEQGYWKFAMRSVSITSDPDVAPAFGYSHAFDHPTDFVKAYQVAASDRFDPPLEDWIDESGVFWADQDTIYLRYVSNDSTYGYDLTKFTGKFQLAFTLELAYRIQPLLPGSKADKEEIYSDKIKALGEALSFEAMKEPPKRPPMGRWASARWGGRVRRENRG